MQFSLTITETESIPVALSANRDGDKYHTVHITNSSGRIAFVFDNSNQVSRFIDKLEVMYKEIRERELCNAKGPKNAMPKYTGPNLA